MDVLNILIGANPGVSSSELWEIVSLDVVLLAFSEDIEAILWDLRWLLDMHELIEMVVDDLADVYD